MTKDMEKAELLNGYLASVFGNDTNCSMRVQPLEVEEMDGEQKAASKIQEEMISGLLCHLGVLYSMRPDGIHLKVLKELANVLTKTLTITCQQPCLTREVPVNWRLANVMPIYKKGWKDDPRNLVPAKFTSKCCYMAFRKQPGNQAQSA